MTNKEGRQRDIRLGDWKYQRMSLLKSPSLRGAAVDPGQPSQTGTRVRLSGLLRQVQLVSARCERLRQ